MIRWAFRTLDAATTYHFEMNPNQMDSPLLERGIDSHATCIDGTIRGFRKDVPKSWSFAGTLRTQEQYEAFETWLAAGRIYLTDHLGRHFIVRLTNFDPVRKGTRRAPWRHTYTCAVTTYEGPIAPDLVPF